MGIIFALLAMVSWGAGDFLIEKGTRKFGDVLTLFYITAFGAIFLLPFIYTQVSALINTGSMQQWALLVITTLVLLGAAVFNFEALRIGKISAMEPIFTLEVLITVALSTILIRETLTGFQLVLIALLIGGIFLVALKSFSHLRHITWERGTLYALIGTVFMGGVNFMFAVTARSTSPLFVNWFASAGVAVLMFLYILYRGRSREIIRGLKRGTPLVLGVSFIDNAAWVAYSYSILYLPIAIATSISESYIALAALLGIVVNKEKLRGHQIVGLIVTIAAAVILAYYA